MNVLVGKNKNILPRNIIVATTNSVFLTQASNLFYAQELQTGIYTATNTQQDFDRLLMVIFQKHKFDPLTA